MVHVSENITLRRDPEHLRPALLTNLWLQGAIIVTGGLVRLTASGLGCSTWPQCTPGFFTPVPNQEQGWHSLVEFGNRLLTLVLVAAAVWVLVGAVRRARRQRDAGSRSFVLWAAVPLLGTLAQAVIGGISVLTKLDPKTVSPHFLLSAALVAFSAWLLVRYDEGAGPPVPAVSAPLRTLARVAAAAFSVVVVLGTSVTGSGPHSGDSVENLRFGFDPLVTSRLHSAAVWLFVICLVAIGAIARRGSGTNSAFRRWWTWALGVALAEGAIGYAQYFLGLPIALVAAHMAVSAVLAALVTFGVCASGRRIDASGPDDARRQLDQAVA